MAPDEKSGPRPTDHQLMTLASRRSRLMLELARLPQTGERSVQSCDPWFRKAK